MAPAPVRPKRPHPGILYFFLGAGFLLLALIGAWLWKIQGGWLKTGMPLEQLLGYVALWLGPSIILWLTGYLLWRGRELRAAIDQLAFPGNRNDSSPQPDGTAVVEQTSRQLERDLKRMSEGLEISLRQASRLRDQLARDLEAMERSTGSAEQRLMNFGKLMEDQHTSLKSISETLEQEEQRIATSLDRQLSSLQGVTETTRTDLTQLSEGIEKGVSRLSHAAGHAQASAKMTSDVLVREVSRLEAISNSSLARIEDVERSYETQQRTLASARENLSKTNAEFNDSFAKSSLFISQLANDVDGRTAALSKAIADMVQRIEGALDVADERAGRLGKKFSGEVTQMVNAAETAAHAIDRAAALASDRVLNTTVDFEASEARTKALMQEAWNKSRNDLQAVLADIRAALSSGLIDFAKANSSFNSVMLEVGGTARTVSNNLDAASHDIQHIMNELVTAGDQRAKELARLLEGHFAALASLSDIRAGDETIAAPARPDLGGAVRQIAASRSGDNTGYWGLVELTAVASALRGKHADGPYSTGARELLGLLKPNAALLERALNEPVPAALIKGGRNIDAGLPMSKASASAVELLGNLWQSDADFRLYGKQFIDSFDAELSELSGSKNNALLTEIYLTSDLGKLYLLLSRAGDERG